MARIAAFAFSRLSSTWLTSRNAEPVGAGENSNAFIFKLSRVICPCARFTLRKIAIPAATSSSMTPERDGEQVIAHRHQLSEIELARHDDADDPILRSGKGAKSREKLLAVVAKTSRYNRLVLADGSELGSASALAISGARSGGAIRKSSPESSAPVRADTARDQAALAISQEDAMRIGLLRRRQFELHRPIELLGKQSNADHAGEFVRRVRDRLLDTDFDFSLRLICVKLRPMQIAPQELAVEIPARRCGERKMSRRIADVCAPFAVDQRWGKSRFKSAAVSDET